MCLYPRLITNPKYKPNKKNGGYPPPVTDTRIAKVPVPCGKCSECRKQRANGWKTRLIEEIRSDKEATFVTLTFSDKSIIELKKWVEENKVKARGYDLENEIATRAVYLFRERWRKATGHSPKHWLITELGHRNTERLHIHGIIWSKDKKLMEELWQYGTQNYYGTYVDERTGNYITKYITKTDLMHKQYNPIVLTSPGIGSGYIGTLRSREPQFKGKDTKTYYRYRNGFKGYLPTYYRNKLYTEKQREELWICKLDKEERWVKGERIEKCESVQGRNTYINIRDWHRQRDIANGYWDGTEDYDQLAYEEERREMLMQKRIEKVLHEEWEDAINRKYMKNRRINYETGEIYKT